MTEIKAPIEQKENNILSISTQFKTEDLLGLLQNLNASLEIDKIIYAFYQFLMENLNIEGISYHCQTFDCVYTCTNQSQHDFTYQLTLNESDLGVLIIKRNIPFSNEELLQIEELICLLINPLNNSLNHYNTLQAAIHDPLTKLLNRATFDEVLSREIKLSQRHNMDFSIIIIDIDNFKRINDKYGHITGDEVLKHFSNRIRKTMRDSDIAFRTGGEEFMVFLSNTDKRGAKTLSERLRTSIINSPFSNDQLSIDYTVSIGIAQYSDSITINDLLLFADKALYKAKKQGKNQSVIY